MAWTEPLPTDGQTPYGAAVRAVLTEMRTAIDVPDLLTSVAGRTGVVVLAKADVGLSNVDNTSDANKPVSTAQAAADALSVPLSAGLFKYGAFISSGLYIASEGSRLTAAIPLANTEYATPIWIANTGTLVRIGINITAAAGVTAGTVVRLGIRADTGTGKPGTLILDAGTVAADAVAAVEATISQAITAPGLYWLTATCQSAGATLPTVRVLAGSGIYPAVHSTLVGALSTGLVAHTQGSVTGALPSPFTANNYVAAACLIAVRG